MKSKIFRICFAGLSLALLGSCAVLDGERPAGGSDAAWEAISNGAPVRVAVFVGPGARGVGMFRWVQIVDRSPQLEATYVDGAAVRAGALRGVDLLAMPGGRSSVQAKDLGEEGQLEVRRFIEDGGSFIGTCAGAFLVLGGKEPEKKTLGLVPYKHLSGRWGGEAMLQVAYTKDAEAMSGIKAGKYMERFNGGPVMQPGPAIPGADFKTMAVFRSNLHSHASKTDLPSMGGCASAVAGTFGKGRVWIFAGHPEYYPKTWKSLQAAFKFATGRDVEFSAPQRKRGQLAVAWWSSPGMGVEGAELARTLVRGDDCDVVPYTGTEFLRNGLRHVDAVVMPDSADTDVVMKLARKGGSIEQLVPFMDRGGKIVTWGRVAESFAGHSNLVVAAAAADVPGILRSIKDAPLPVPGAPPPPKVERPVRVAEYMGAGAAGAASLQWAKLLSLSPQCEYTAIDARDVRRGVLKDFDVYIAPGGNGSTHGRALKPSGLTNLLEFVRAGGGYFGSCAGCYMGMSLCGTDRPTAKRLGFVPYGAQKTPYRGGSELEIRFTENAGMFGLRPGSCRDVRYHGGPVLLPVEGVTNATVKTIATFDCDGVYAYNTLTKPTMAGTPAIVAGTFGKGRVVCISPHPESYDHTQDIILGGLKYITGRDFKSEYPQRSRGNLSVAFHASYPRKDGAMLAARLLREPSLDVHLIDSGGIGRGDLEHCDVLVLGHPKKRRFTKFVRSFAEKGGSIVVFGSEKELSTVPHDVGGVVKFTDPESVRLYLLASASCIAPGKTGVPTVVVEYGGDWSAAGRAVWKTLRGISPSEARVVGWNDAEHPDPETKKVNDALAEKYPRSLRQPAVVAASPEGKCFCVIENVPIGTRPGVIMDRVREADGDRMLCEALLEAAARTNGIVAAELAGECAGRMSGRIGLANVRSKKFGWHRAWEMLEQEDPADATGWRRALTMGNAMSILTKVSDFKGDVEKSLAYLAEEEAKPSVHLTVEQKQGLKMARFVALRGDKSRHDEVMTLLRKTVDMDPDSFWGVGAAGFIGILGGPKPANTRPVDRELRSRRKVETSAGGKALALARGAENAAKAQGATPDEVVRGYVVHIAGGARTFEKLAEEEGGEDFVLAFLSDAGWMEDFAGSGNVPDAARSLQLLSTLWWNDRAALSTPGMWRRFATALALNEPLCPTDPRKCVAMMAAYKELFAEGRLHDYCREHTCRRWRDVLSCWMGRGRGELITAEELRALNGERNAPVRSMPCHGRVRYHKDFLGVRAWAHRYPRYLVHPKTCGQCIRLSWYAVKVAQSHGIPANTANMGGMAHLAYLMLASDGKWRIHNKACKWATTFFTVFDRDELRESNGYLFKDLEELVFSAPGRIDSERLRWKAALVDDAAARESLYRRSVGECAVNFVAWQDYAEWLGRGEGGDAERFCRHAVAAFADCPFAAWRLLRSVLPMVKAKHGKDAVVSVLGEAVSGLKEIPVKKRCYEPHEYAKVVAFMDEILDHDRAAVGKLLDMSMEVNAGNRQVADSVRKWRQKNGATGSTGV